jgi:phosphopantetheine adenylyltransferase
VAPTPRAERNYWPYFVTALVALLVGGLPGWIIGIQAPSEDDVQRVVDERVEAIEQRLMALEETVHVIEERQQNVIATNGGQSAAIASLEARISALETQIQANTLRLDNLSEGGP